jgi:hypothetical protein
MATPDRDQPERLLSFVETRAFQSAWSACGLTLEDLYDLQTVLLLDPKAGKVIPKTGGLRKLRFAPAATGRGKSGSCRVCYVHFAAHGLVLLAAVYPKSAKADLSDDDKKRIRQAIERQEQLLNRKRGKT